MSVIRLAAAYVALLLIAAIYTYQRYSLHPASGVVASVWSHGRVLKRTVAEGETSARTRLAPTPAETVVLETIEGRAPLPWVHRAEFNRVGLGNAEFSDALLSLSLFPGRDGVEAVVDGQSTFVTAEDLLAAQAYDHQVDSTLLGLSIGVDVRLLLNLLSASTGLSREELAAKANLFRVRFRRLAAENLAVENRAIADPSPQAQLAFRKGATEASAYLSRNLDESGRFRYLVRATTNEVLPGYDWTRHAGTLFFLAHAANATGAMELKEASGRAAGALRSSLLTSCGIHACMSEGPTALLGLNALSVVALVEMLPFADDDLRRTTRALIEYLRSQARSNGDFDHEFDRTSGLPREKQYLYYSGEATLALARAYEWTHDPIDLTLARRGLERLVGTWSFFGSHYYFGQEHWTCQAMEALGRHAPSESALAFCIRVQAFDRALQVRGASTADSAGAYAFLPAPLPQVAQVASHAEGLAATLRVARTVHSADVEALEGQLSAALEFLLRRQAVPRHLLVDPAAMSGGLPASEVDWNVRIDVVQHAGSAFLSADALARDGSRPPRTSTP